MNRFRRNLVKITNIFALLYLPHLHFTQVLKFSSCILPAAGRRPPGCSGELRSPAAPSPYNLLQKHRPAPISPIRTGRSLSGCCHGSSATVLSSLGRAINRTRHVTVSTGSYRTAEHATRTSSPAARPDTNTAVGPSAPPMIAMQALSSAERPSAFTTVRTVSPGAASCRSISPAGSGGSSVYRISQ